MDKNNNKETEIDFLKENDVVSSTECTGLIQGFPDCDEEMDSYRSIYKIPRQGDLSDLDPKCLE